MKDPTNRRMAIFTGGLLGVMLVVLFGFGCGLYFAGALKVDFVVVGVEGIVGVLALSLIIGWAAAQ